MYFIEKNKKILGQEKKLYYSGSNNWTTHYDRRKSYKTFDEANKKFVSLLPKFPKVIPFPCRTFSRALSFPLTIPFFDQSGLGNPHELKLSRKSNKIKFCVDLINFIVKAKDKGNHLQHV